MLGNGLFLLCHYRCFYLIATLYTVGLLYVALNTQLIFEGGEVQYVVFLITWYS